MWCLAYAVGIITFLSRYAPTKSQGKDMHAFPYLIIGRGRQDERPNECGYAVRPEGLHKWTWRFYCGMISIKGDSSARPFLFIQCLFDQQSYDLGKKGNWVSRHYSALALAGRKNWALSEASVLALGITRFRAS